MPVLHEGMILCDRYRVVRPIGEGGMGAVYEGVHERLSARVVIKTIMPSFAEQPEFRARFLLEARAAARLSSPYVVKVFDVDVTEDGTLFMVMEHLEGETLSERSKREPPMTVEEVARCGMQVCAGLEEAHRAGFVHRDIKPSNIFLVGVGREAIAKVLDFGVVKAIGTSDAHIEVPKTRTGALMGTTHYIAPEQLKGEVPDPRADVWSLGVVLYRVLAKCLPFAGDSETVYFANVLTRSATPIEDQVPGLPRGFARAVMGALESDPTLRHPSAAAFAGALAPFSGTGESLLPAPVVPEPTDEERTVRDGPIRDAQSSVPSVPPSRGPIGSSPSLAASAVEPGSQPIAAKAPPRRLALAGVLVALVVVALAAVAVGVTVLRRSSKDASANASAGASMASAGAAPSIASAAPSVAVAPSESAPPPPMPSASATASAAPSPRPSASAPRKRPVGPRPAASAPAIPPIL